MLPCACIFRFMQQKQCSDELSHSPALNWKKTEKLRPQSPCESWCRLGFKSHVVWMQLLCSPEVNPTQLGCQPASGQDSPWLLFIYQYRHSLGIFLLPESRSQCLLSTWSNILNHLPSTFLSLLSLSSTQSLGSVSFCFCPPLFFSLSGAPQKHHWLVLSKMLIDP